MPTVDDSNALKPGQCKSILERYAPPAGSYDEIVDTRGIVRERWSAVANRLRELGSDDFGRRVVRTRRIVQENGVTYSATAGEGSGRSWVMDPLPMIVGHEEWSAIEKGITQRVRLINSVLADIYGPQKLMRGGQIPPVLVHANPGFLRPCHGFRPQNGVYVHIYAADLARGRDGSWRVLADRVDVPSGIGYAVENRFITQQVMPDLFRAAGPVRLKPFFERMFESFETLVRRRTERPCIVMLSPGPNFETYFEQAFFARNLGYPLVEGADLTTRDNTVYLKTVNGLRQVDVIIRNVPSADCDPLELDSTSCLGVPGLVEAARAGNVVVANCLGSGVMESPAMPAFFAPLCRNLLGEELKMPSADTYWCGDSHSLDFTLANLDKLVVKPLFRRRSGEAVFSPLLSASERDELRNRIKADPASYCAQELTALATLPALNAAGDPEARHSIMRVFLVANKNGYEMMPGALTRVTRELGSYSVSMAEGGSSKDTWMIAPPDMPLEDHALPHTGPVRILRSTAGLTSREADNLFWTGRYMERTDYMTRLLRLLASEMREVSGASLPVHITPFLNTALGTQPHEERDPVFKITKAEALLDDLIWNKAFAPGLCSALLCLHGTASSVRERLSIDAVNIINRLAAAATEEPGEEERRAYVPRLNEIGMLLAGVSGSMCENMTRATDWRFLDLGRRIERALNLVEVMRHVFTCGGAISAQMMSSLLVCADSRYTYASRYLTNMQVEPVVDLLLLDETNPRSVIFQTRIIAEHIAALHSDEDEEPQTFRLRLALGLDSGMRLADARELSRRDGDGYVLLTKLLAKASDNLQLLADQIALHYFSHSDRSAMSSRSY